MSETARIIGVDCGFTAMGVVIAEGRTLLDYEVYRTSKNTTKRDLRVADDDADRCQQLAGFLRRYIDAWKPVGAVVELPHGGAQGARANRAMGMSTAIVASVLELEGLAAEWVTPADVKKAACGRRDASKEQVQAAVKRAFEWERWPQYKWELDHVGDALGAVLAAENGLLVRALGRAVG